MRRAIGDVLILRAGYDSWRVRAQPSPPVGGGPPSAPRPRAGAGAGSGAVGIAGAGARWQRLWGAARGGQFMPTVWRRRIEAETAPPLPRTAVSGQRPT